MVCPTDASVTKHVGGDVVADAGVSVHVEREPAAAAVRDGPRA